MLLRLVKYVLCCCLVFGCSVLYGQKDYQLGISYQYGAALNLHPTNDKVWPPSDVSVPALFFQLNPGVNKLGFRVMMGWRTEAIRFHVLERFYLKQRNSGLDFKLQCTLPLSDKTTLALGMSPRLLTKSTYMTEYKNELNNAFYGESTFVPEQYNGLNKVNAALSLSFYYRFAKRWQFSAHLDHDMLATHKEDLSTAFLFDESFNYQDKYVNGRLTSLSLALAFIIKSHSFN